MNYSFVRPPHSSTPVFSINGWLGRIAQLRSRTVLRVANEEKELDWKTTNVAAIGDTPKPKVDFSGANGVVTTFSGYAGQMAGKAIVETDFWFWSPSQIFDLQQPFTVSFHTGQAVKFVGDVIVQKIMSSSSAIVVKAVSRAVVTTIGGLFPYTVEFSCLPDLQGASFYSTTNCRLGVYSQQILPDVSLDPDDEDEDEWDLVSLFSSSESSSSFQLS